MKVRILNQVRRGFTLIEMVVVLVILAAIAALVIPRLGFLKDQADSATAAAGAAQVASNLETCKLTTGSYPLGMDSLLASGGTAVYSRLYTHTAGPTTFGLGVDITAGTIPATTSTDRWGESFGHSFQPNPSYYVYDHDAASADPSNSGTVLRTFSSAGGKPVATVTGTSLLQAAGFPGGLPTDGSVMLIAFGVGPNTASVGTTMASAPRHTAQNEDSYGRYVAIFAIYKSGKSAELKTVVDSYGNSPDKNVSSFKKSSPSLPGAPTP